MIEHTRDDWEVRPTTEPCDIRDGYEIVSKNLGGVIAYVNNEENACVMACGHEAPHECADPQCPGDINRRKLEAYPDLVNGTHKTVVWLRRLAKQFDECATEYREVADQLDIALGEAPGKERRAAAGT